MSKFRAWYIRNQDAITWFLIGWLAACMLRAIADEQYIWAVIDAGFIYFNYKLIDTRIE